MVGSEIDNPELIKLAEEAGAWLWLTDSVLVHFREEIDYS